MYAKQPKKLLILNILDILWKDSDQDHRLTQREIGEILRTRYGMAADRKAIKRNLMDLAEFGFDIEYREVPRGGAGEEEENTILTDFYLVRPFTEGELRLLIDGLLFSPPASPPMPGAGGKAGRTLQPLFPLQGTPHCQDAWGAGGQSAAVPQH